MAIPLQPTRVPHVKMHDQIGGLSLRYLTRARSPLENIPKTQEIRVGISSRGCEAQLDAFQFQRDFHVRGILDWRQGVCGLIKPGLELLQGLTGFLVGQGRWRRIARHWHP